MDETYECPKCSGKMTLPSEISEQVQAEIAEVCRGPRKIDAIVFIRRKLDVGLGEGKFMVNHISKSDGTCGDAVTNCLKAESHIAQVVIVGI